jgi:hypothetical protein
MQETFFKEKENINQTNFRKSNNLLRDDANFESPFEYDKHSGGDFFVEKRISLVSHYENKKYVRSRAEPELRINVAKAQNQIYEAEKSTFTQLTNTYAHKERMADLKKKMEFSK